MGPTFLIIGAQRCAMATVWAGLREHPEVCVANEKELHYFDNDPNRYEPGWYERQFEHCDGIAGEATPIYCFHPDSLQRIHNYNPEMQLIMLLRNPVHRAVSHYRLEFSRNDEGLPMLAAFQAEEERLASSPKYSKALFNYSYLARGRYHEQLDRVYELFSPEQVLVLLTYDVNHSFLWVMAQITDFVGAPRWDGYSQTRYNVSHPGYPPPTPETVQFLEDYFRPHNRLLREKHRIDTGGRW